MDKIKGLVVILLFFGNFITAQPGGGWRNMPPDSIAARATNLMIDSLNLSSAQASKVEAVNLEYAKKQSAARQQSEGDREAMRATMQQLRREQSSALEKYLTADQFAKWQSIQQERREMRRQRGEGRRGKRKNNTPDRS